MGNKGSNTTTTTTTAPNPAAMSAYNSLLERAARVASQPYSPYEGELVAPINAQQQLGIGNINQYAGFALPYIQQAAGLAGDLGRGPTGAQLESYLNPYTQNVIDATQAQFARANAAQQNELRSRAAAQSALGGSSAKVAAGDLAYQQQLGQAPAIAHLYAQNYSDAVNNWMRNMGVASQTLGNLGVAGQQAGLAGAGAQVGAGSLQLQNQQQFLDALYRQYQIAQAFPYQQAQWLAGMQTGVGSQMGGTSSTTAPKPSPLASIFGLGLAGAGVAGGLGWKPFAARGGRVAGFDDGGGVGGAVPAMPYAGVGFIPQIGVARGPGAPPPPRPPGEKDQMAPIRDAMAFARSLRDRDVGTGEPMDLNAYGPAGVGEIMPPAPPTGFGPIYRRGGRIAGFADGGAPLDQSFNARWAPLDEEGQSFDTRWAPTREAERGIWYHPPIGEEDQSFESRWTPTREAIASGEFDPQGSNNNLTYAPGDREAGYEGLPTNGEAPLPRPRPEMAGVGAPDVGGWMPAPREGEVPAGPPGGGPIMLPPTAGVGATRPGLDSSSALWPALTAAGFAMMASRSPHLGVAIGEGGLAGVGAYTRAQEKATETALKREQMAQQNKRLDLQAKRLEEAAERARQTLALHTRTAESTEAYRKALIERENYRPTGSVTEDGAPILYDTRRPGRAINGVTGEEIKPGTKVLSARAAAVDVEPTLSGPALEGAAERYLQTGTLPPNMGRGAQGAANSNAVQTRAAELAVERGIDARDVPKRWQQFRGEQVAIQRFMSGPQGNTIRSLNVVVEHLDTLQQLADALKAPSDVQLWNRVAQAFQEQFGYAAPTNLDAAKNIVGTEIIKALGVTGAGTVEERREAGAAFSRIKSPEQLRGAIGDAVRPLLLGQLRGLRAQFTAATGLPAEKFDEMLLPGTKQFFGATTPHGAATAPATAAPSPAAPPVGHINKGYRFKGGDPSKRENWEKVTP